MRLLSQSLNLAQIRMPNAILMLTTLSPKLRSLLVNAIRGREGAQVEGIGVDVEYHRYGASGLGFTGYFFLLNWYIAILDSYSSIYLSQSYLAKALVFPKTDFEGRV